MSLLGLVLLLSQRQRASSHSVFFLIFFFFFEIASVCVHKISFFCFLFFFSLQKAQYGQNMKKPLLCIKANQINCKIRHFFLLIYLVIRLPFSSLRDTRIISFGKPILASAETRYPEVANDNLCHLEEFTLFFCCSI